MTNWLAGIDFLLFIGLPYASLALFVVGCIYRFTHRNRSIVIPPSQFLEAERHFWGVVPLHYGIVAVLAMHGLCLLVPQLVMLWNVNPVRLQVVEIACASAGLFALAGLVLCVERRLTAVPVRRLTSWVDLTVLALLGIQLTLGLLVSVFHPWGTTWLSAAGAPYIRSLLLLSPEITPVTNAPLLVKAHLANAFVLMAIAPFSGLIHFLLLPVTYLGRAWIVFRRYEKRQRNARA